VETFEINGVSYSVERAKLKRWIGLGRIQDEIQQAVARKDASEVASNLCLYVSTACNVSVEEIQDAPWIEITNAYMACFLVNTIGLRLPMFQISSKDESTMPWNYDGRTWYGYVHTFSKEFGWSIEYIAELDVDDAFALIQEITVSDQMHREWEWSLSDKSVTRDEATGKYKFVPLTRPHWMQEVPKLPEKTKIPKAFLPVGNVISFRDDQNVVH
jgi:hypothetical protein